MMSIYLYLKDSNSNEKVYKFTYIYSWLCAKRHDVCT